MAVNLSRSATDGLWTTGPTKRPQPSALKPMAYRFDPACIRVRRQAGCGEAEHALRGDGLRLCPRQRRRPRDRREASKQKKQATGESQRMEREGGAMAFLSIAIHAAPGVADKADLELRCCAAAGADVGRDKGRRRQADVGRSGSVLSERMARPGRDKIRPGSAKRGPRTGLAVVINGP